MSKDKAKDHHPMEPQEQAQGQQVAMIGGLPAVVDYGEDAGAGVENVAADEFKIPLWKILQSNSPQCKPIGEGGLAGAVQSNIIRFDTNETYDGKIGVDFIPCFRDHYYIERHPYKDGGGGFVGVRKPDDDLVVHLREKAGKFGKLKTDQGTELVETYALTGIFLPVDGTHPLGYGIAPFQSTQIGKYQSFIALVTGASMSYPNSQGKIIVPPMWAHRWHLGTRPEKRTDGSFYGWTFAPKEAPPIKCRLGREDELYVLGKKFHELVKSGKAKADIAGAEAKGGAADDDIPM